MPYTANKRFNTSAFMKARKEAREKKIFEQRHLAELKRIGITGKGEINLKGTKLLNICGRRG